MQKHARNSALFAILNCFRLRKQMASNKKATSRICFHENNSLTFALIYFHPPPFPALTSRGRVGNSLPSRPRPSHLAHSRSLALTHAALTHSLALARAGRRRVGCVNKNSQNKPTMQNSLACPLFLFCAFFCLRLLKINGAANKSELVVQP